MASSITRCTPNWGVGLYRIERQLGVALDEETLGRFLISAIEKNQEERAITILQERKVNLHLPDTIYGYPALHLAVFFGRTAIVEKILEQEDNGVNENQGRRIRNTPLMIAISKKNTEIAWMLIQKMSEEGINKPNSLGTRPLSLAFQNKQGKIARQLILSRAIDREKNQSYLIDEIIKDRIIAPMPIIIALSIKLDICHSLNNAANSALNIEALQRLIFFKLEVQRYNLDFQCNLKQALQGFVSEEEGVEPMATIINEYV